MKYIILTIALITSTIMVAQNTDRLDDNNGYKSLKFGTPISSIEGLGITFITTNKYKVNDPSDYYIDNIKIDKITIQANSQGLIETVSLFFNNEYKRLESIARDTGKNLTNRKAAYEELKVLAEKGTPFTKYLALVRTEYGNATSTHASSQVWTGKKVFLAITSSPEDGGGIMFSLKEIEKPKAINKFN